MNHFTILHNSRCSQSRQALKFLQDHWASIEIIDYQKWYLSHSTLKHLQKLLWGIAIIDFMRKWEKEFTQLWLSKNSTDDELLKAMVLYPNLLQRPIIIKNNTFAVIARDENALKSII